MGVELVPLGPSWVEFPHRTRTVGRYGGRDRFKPGGPRDTLEPSSEALSPQINIAMGFGVTEQSSAGLIAEAGNRRRARAVGMALYFLVHGSEGGDGVSRPGVVQLAG